MAGVFQSTLPARGATDADVLFLCNVEFQSTLPARGATRVTKAECLDLPISIHAPRTGSDGRGASAAVGQARFQSTLPARGATHAQKAVVLTLPISIHAPRTGSDTVLAPSRTQSNDFNPRSPHGERLRLHQRRRFQLLFQSTLPARGATGHWVLTASTKQFQSTLPARGAT